MKFKTCSIIAILFLTLIAAKTMYCQEKKCFKLEITSVLKGGKWDGLKNYEYVGSFESQEECRAKKGEVIRRISAKEGMFGGNWILDEVSKDCEPCYKNKEKNGFTQRNTSLEKDYIDQIADKKLMSWYRKNVISPINAGNIVKLLGVYAESVPLQTLGTAIGAYGIARAYIKMFEQSSEAALKRAMELLNIAWEDRNKFLSASGGYLLSAPDEYVTWEDPYLANNAFLKAAEATYIKPTEDDVYVTSALLGVIGLIAAETGNEEIATVFLTEAVELLADVSDTPRRTQLAELMQNTNTSFSLNIKPLNDLNSFAKTSREQKIINIAGEYECISGLGCEENQVGTKTRSFVAAGVQITMTTTISPLTVIQNGNNIKTIATRTIAGRGNYYSKTVTTTEGNGLLKGDKIELNYITTVEQSVEGGENLQQSYSGKCTIRILGNRDLQFTSLGSDGTTFNQIYRRR